MDLATLLIIGGLTLGALSLLMKIVDWINEGHIEMSRLPKEMRAQYAGVCSCGCDLEILPGHKIAYYGPGELYHWDCRPRAQEQEAEKRGNTDVS